MRVLGIETATHVCAVSLIQNKSLVHAESLDATHIHSEKLMGMIHTCLESSGWKLTMLDGIAISIGPGSFTGLRIGLSVAKGLSYASGIPLLAVPTLRALAYRAQEEHFASAGDLILPLIDARRDEVYSAIYRVTEDGLSEVLPSAANSGKELLSLLPVKDRIVLMGDGAEKFYTFLQKQFPERLSNIYLPPGATRMCSATAVALSGVEQFECGDVANVSTLEPLYVKEFFTLVVPQHSAVTR